MHRLRGEKKNNTAGFKQNKVITFIVMDGRDMDKMFYHDPRLDAGLKNERLLFMEDGGRPDLIDGSYEKELAEQMPFRPAANDTAVFNEIETDRLAVLNRVREVVAMTSTSKMTAGKGIGSHLRGSKGSEDDQEIPDLQNKPACSINGCANQRSTIWLLEERNRILEVALVLLAIVIICYMFR